jgi:hypothetical protein
VSIEKSIQVIKSIVATDLIIYHLKSCTQTVSNFTNLSNYSEVVFFNIIKNIKSQHKKKGFFLRLGSLGKKLQSRCGRGWILSFTCFRNKGGGIERGVLSWEGLKIKFYFTHRHFAAEFVCLDYKAIFFGRRTKFIERTQIMVLTKEGTSNKCYNKFDTIIL